MGAIEDRVKALLTMQGISLDSTIEYTVNEKPYTLSYRFIIESYMQASGEAKLVFLTALEKSQKVGEMGVEKFFEGMGQLLLMGSLSEKL
jgi:hypothetical protein